jgi:hypothetical protein
VIDGAVDGSVGSDHDCALLGGTWDPNAAATTGSIVDGSCPPFAECMMWDLGPGPNGFRGPEIAAPAQEQEPCVKPNAFQRVGIAVQGFVANIIGSGVGVGLGANASAGTGVGWSGTLSRQVLVTPNGDAAFVTTVTNPFAIAAPFNSVGSAGTAASLGFQFSTVGGANTPADVAGPSVNFGAGGGRVFGGNTDVSLTAGSTGQAVVSSTATLGTR